MSMLAPPFQLLEVNLISAQDLAPVSKSIKAYAVAWLNPERKLTTQIDPDGHDNPTWNEKFVFRVDEEFLQAEDSVIMIEIYSSAWLRDVLIGTVGVLLSNLLNNRKSKVRFVALQVRRPSGRPQGILNIGVNLVDATMRSMPMYSELSASAVEYWDIMDPKKQKPNQSPIQTHENPPANYDSKLMTLQRSQSEKNDSTINDYTYNPNRTVTVLA
ncbi:C2 domain [Sesbania bispinosa]|nr:C2 domain [Sesbania bispinosa]